MGVSAFAAIKTTGGTAGALDDIAHTNIVDGDLAFVIDATNDISYFYTYNSSSAAAESDPDVINPDSNSGNGRWILTEGYFAALQLATGTNVNELSIDGTLAGNSDDAIPTEKAVKTYVDDYLKSPTVSDRSNFTYNGGATAYTVKVGAGKYMCKDKHCYWNSELTTGAIGTPAANDWYYLYLDYSAITSWTAITNSELIWSNTEPAWNSTYKAWMNSDDTCIFAVRTNSGDTNILEFFHYGDFIVYADDIADRTPADLDDTWTDVTLTLPKFCTQAECGMYSATPGGAGASVLSWRTNGQTGSDGHAVCQVNSESGLQFNNVRVHTDSSQVIEVVHSASDDSTCGIYTHGWFMPNGM